MFSILVVDDEDSVRELVKEMLSRDGYTIYEASNGQEAVDSFNEHPVDLILTDLVMPEKSGIDLIMQLKNENSQVKVVAISGGGGITGRFDYLPIAKLLGARAIIRKPFTMAEIRKAVSEALAA